MDIAEALPQNQKSPSVAARTAALTGRRVPELLAPAGGRAQLQAAVRFGADAVYLAADRFGLRQRAENFALADVADAVAFAHAAGVRVYVALNTLMHDEDLAALPAYLEALAAAGADAFIVSDLGAFRMARRHAPQAALHISTQASVANAEAARAWHELGAARVVLAREMSVEQIARLRADVPRSLELEAFVHGAMCMAYSGRCLLSSVMTGRSGNKGACAQPCRWSYALVEEKRPGEYFPIEEGADGSYVLNAQDLNMLAHLDDLRAAGVDSFKIEGRNKRAFYVASVVHAYRAVMDGADPAAVEPELYAVSHRPYGTGFYYGRAQQSPERDGYQKEYLHAATVVACEPYAPAGRRVVAGGEPSASSGSEAGGVTGAGCRTDASANDVAGAGASSAPGTWRVRATCHNRFCEGDTLEALQPRAPIAPLTVRHLCWLQPASGDAASAAAAGAAAVAMSAPAARDSASSTPVDAPCSTEEAGAALVPVTVANRTAQDYVFLSEVPLAPGDLLRIRIG